MRSPERRPLRVVSSDHGSPTGVGLVVEATGLADAIERAADYLHTSAMAAGLGRVVLCAAGAASGLPDGRA